MDMKVTSVFGVVVALVLVAQTLASPLGDQASEVQKRPKYMDTRDLKPFKELLLLALGELVDEGVISPDVFNKKGSAGDASKRGRAYLGMCFVRTSSGVQAEPCWKNEAQ